MATPSQWHLYDAFVANLGKSIFQLNSDVLKVALYPVGANADVSNMSNPEYGNINPEVSGNGYVAGGKSLGASTWTGASSTKTLSRTTGIATFTASSGSITARVAVLYDNTDTSKRAIAWCYLDWNGSQSFDVVISQYFTLTLTVPATILTVASAAPSGVNFRIYNDFLLDIGKKQFDLSAGVSSLQVALFTTSSNCGSQSVSPATYGNFTNELPDGNGYSQNGVSCNSTEYSKDRFSIAAPAWFITPGLPTFRYAVLYIASDASKRAIGYWDLGSTSWSGTDDENIITTNDGGGTPETNTRIYLPSYA